MSDQVSSTTIPNNDDDETSTVIDTVEQYNLISSSDNPGKKYLIKYLKCCNIILFK